MRKSTPPPKEGKNSFFNEDVWEQSVSLGGYEWYGTGVERVLAVRIEAEIAGAAARTFNPVTEKLLYIKFANLKPTEESFRNFANEFGLLAVDTRTLNPEEVPGLPEKWRLIGERFLSWWTEWTRFSNAYKIFRSIQDGTAEGLAASEVVRTIINSALPGRTYVQVVWKPERKENGFQIAPMTLLGAVWWQFAKAFTNGVNYRPCRVCGESIEIGKGASSKNKELCSPACRSADHRAKVLEARELADAGKTLKQIASHFNAKSKKKLTPEIIAGWLTKDK